MKAAIYCRVSDDKKKSDGDRRQDVTRQMLILGEHITRKGIIDFEQYTDDGKSAFTDDINQRPAFRKLMNDCRRHYINEIYIEDMTRFSRNLSMGLQWIKELGDLNVQLISLKEGDFEATSAQGWMKSTITLMFAEWDSRIKSEKVKSGMSREGNVKICESCGVAHLGRHPLTCKCSICLKKGRSKAQYEKKKKQGA